MLSQSSYQLTTQKEIECLICVNLVSNVVTELISSDLPSCGEARAQWNNASRWSGPLFRRIGEADHPGPRPRRDCHLDVNLRERAAPSDKRRSRAQQGLDVLQDYLQVTVSRRNS